MECVFSRSPDIHLFFPSSQAPKGKKFSLSSSSAPTPGLCCRGIQSRGCFAPFVQCWTITFALTSPGFSLPKPQGPSSSFFSILVARASGSSSPLFFIFPPFFGSSLPFPVNTDTRSQMGFPQDPNKSGPTEHIGICPRSLVLLVPLCHARFTSVALLFPFQRK